MEHTKALNALEPFLALTKSATSSLLAADLIQRATSAPNTFVFTELLETTPVQNLASSPDHAGYLALLEIFSYGTYTTYTTTPNLPALNDVQILKLRQLTLLALARDSSSAALSYTSLIQELGLSNARELESLVVSAVYAGLLQAQLDPARQKVRVNHVTPLRDVAPGAVGGMLDALRGWAARCDDTLARLESQMTAVREQADRRAREASQWQARMDALVEEEIKAKGTSSSGAGANAGLRLTSRLRSSSGGSGSTGDHFGAHMLTGFGGTGEGEGSGSSLVVGAVKSASSKIAGFASRFGKRNSDKLDDDGQDGVDDEAMDIDDEDESTDAKSRSSRRKLEG